MDGYPRWEVRDPLATFPAPNDPDDLVPSDTIYNMRRSRKWLEDTYELGAWPKGQDAGLDKMFDVLQYCDADEIVMVLVGEDQDSGRPSPFLLDRQPNLAGTPWNIVPGRITLGRLQGQFDQMIGMHETNAELWALQLHAVKRGIFPETWITSDGQRQIDYVPADAITGDIGTVEGGSLTQFRVDPGFQTLPAIDRLEQAQRVAGAVPSEFGGFGATNVRTGRRGSQVMGASIDFPIQEHQEILAESLEQENRVAIKIAKAYWGNTTRTFVIPGVRKPVVYTPNLTFETEDQFVSYAYAGTDSNGLVIEGGQRVGMGTMSKSSFMDIDPLIQDADLEHDRVVQ
jgi:hypothetical protein